MKTTITIEASDESQLIGKLAELIKEISEERLTELMDGSLKSESGSLIEIEEE